MALLLIVGLLVLNGAAIREIVSARDRARALAQLELDLRVEERSQALRATLAGLLRDLAQLADSPPLAAVPERLTGDDPLASRWARLDAEGALLLFAQPRPAVKALALVDERGAAVLGVHRRGDTLLSGPSLRPGPSALIEGDGPALPAASWLAASVPLPSSAARLEIRIDPDLALPEEPAGYELAVSPIGGQPAESTGETALAEGTAAPIEASRNIPIEGWQPASELQIVGRQQPSGGQLTTMELASRYRRTVLWNLVVIAALSATVLLALIQLRRRARAEAAAAHERRVRDLERGLVHKERLASVGRFAAGIAHEVNNPLTGSSNHLSLLESRLDDSDIEAARSEVGRVREGLERAAGIVRRTLTYADSGAEVRTPVSLVESAEEAIRFLRPRFPEIRFELGSPAAPIVVANPVALGQVFLNLLTNACEVQRGTGEVAIRLDLCDSVASVTIEDSGPGLSDEALERLFEPFFSTRGSTGLGLSICHGIVTEHGGTLRAANRAGGGARFTIELPAAEPSGPTAAVSSTGLAG